ncbi:metallophosphoesterase [Ferviditalea candida]|uniref:Metallophosphoesterase n=1 Tax=Ferviditalea candida TaxID=3108399 RepID=A0ABU5ZII3_9BACL|nr:metallophosphoesterase [Paenibacillaceae bacterium T2]
MLSTAFMVFFPMSLIYFLYRGYANTRDVAVNRISLNHQHASGSGGQSHKLNVLHISDMHLENISISPDQLYDKLKDETIDLIALTGDFLDRKRSIPKMVPYLKALNNLNPAHGVYAVLGNHDYVLRPVHLDKLKQTLEEHNCRTLINEWHSLRIKGNTINIIGIDDYSTRRSDISAAYEGKPEGFDLVLTHDPNIVLNMRDISFHYLLSGHFHGGQIHWPKPFHLLKMGKLVRLNMIKGLHVYHGKPFYISEGLGQTGLNIRVGCRPEITIHQLHVPSVSLDDQQTDDGIVA